MARKTNYSFERHQREKAKAEKSAERERAKAEKSAPAVNDAPGERATDNIDAEAPRPLSDQPRS